ncbi:MAG: hypothetical protein B9S34_09275 [Opitutia bacterium Tous-C1TDCM]|nr:MAG: hypothetical protein B9S34_09275 [Opitutae bacterium Tous-C1TDCM]
MAVFEGEVGAAAPAEKGADDLGGEAFAFVLFLLLFEDLEGAGNDAGFLFLFVVGDGGFGGDGGLLFGGDDFLGGGLLDFFHRGFDGDGGFAAGVGADGAVEFRELGGGEAGEAEALFLLGGEGAGKRDRGFGGGGDERGSHEQESEAQHGWFLAAGGTGGRVRKKGPPR